MNWKDQLGSALLQRNVVRLDYLNKQLEGAVEEWAAYLREFSNVRLEVTKENDYIDGQLFARFVAVVDAPSLKFPYRTEVAYRVDPNRGLHLVLKHAVDVNLRDAIDNKKDCYVYGEEVFTEAEIHERNYVIVLMNNRFLDWLEQMRQ